MDDMNDIRHDLFSHDEELVQEWVAKPEEEQKRHLAMNIIGMRKDLRAGAKKFEAQNSRLGDHEDRIGCLETWKTKVKTVLWTLAKVAGVAILALGAGATIYGCFIR